MYSKAVYCTASWYNDRMLHATRQERTRAIHMQAYLITELPTVASITPTFYTTLQQELRMYCMYTKEHNVAEPRLWACVYTNDRHVQGNVP